MRLFTNGGVSMDNQSRDEQASQDSAVPQQAETAQPINATPAAFAAMAGEIGAQLVALREKRGMSIEDVSARLKVSAQKLQRLESGQWDSLPEMPFVQGVVRGYARMMGADPEPLVEPLRRFGRASQIEIPQPHSSAPSIPKSPVRFRSPVATQQAKWPWALAALIVIAGAAWYFGGGHKTSRGSADVADLASAPSADAAAEPASQPVVADADATPPGADASNTSNTTTTSSTTPVAPLATATVASAAAAQSATVGAGLIAAVDPTHVVAALASSPVAAAPAPQAPASAPSASAAGNGKIALRLKSDSWVEVRQKDGKVVFSQLLRAGSTQEISGDAPLKVVVGNVAGVESLQFNGQPVEIKSRNAGNVARLTLQ